MKTELNPEDPVFSLTSYSLADPKLWPELISFNKNNDAQLYVVLLTKPENPSDLQEWGKEFLRVNNAPHALRCLSAREMGHVMIRGNAW